MNLSCNSPALHIKVSSTPQFVSFPLCRTLSYFIYESTTIIPSCNISNSTHMWRRCHAKCENVCMFGGRWLMCIVVNFTHTHNAMKARLMDGKNIVWIILFSLTFFHVDERRACHDDGNRWWENETNRNLCDAHTHTHTMRCELILCECTFRHKIYDCTPFEDETKRLGFILCHRVSFSLRCSIFILHNRKVSVL